MRAVALCCLLLAAVSSACADQVGTPRFQQVGYPGNGVFQCHFQHPLAECRVHVSSHTGYSGNAFVNVLVLGNGSDSARVDIIEVDAIYRTDARYFGGGLDQGHCGLALAVKDWSLAVLVECLGRAEDGGWSRGWGLMTTHRGRDLPVTVTTPRLVLAVAGTDVSVLFTAHGGALDGCAIATPEAGRVDLSPDRTLPSDSRYRQHGAGAEQGQCGWTLPNVTQRDAGVWVWWGWHRGSMAYQTSVVLVLTAPEGGPELQVHAPSRLRVGSLLNATCRAPPGVPPAKLSWFLGDVEVRRDSANHTLPGDVGSALPWQPQPAVQTLTRTLTEGDRGKRLECRMAHEGLDHVVSVGHDLELPGGGPECGVRRVSGSTPIEGGAVAAVAVPGEFPWHVGVYQSEGNGAYKQTCGGTLVSSQFVISAAHCFWDESMDQLKPRSLYKVAAGKHRRAWRPKEPDTQERAVAAISVPRRYLGRHSNYQHDIAVVRLARSVTWTPSVQPACVDWTERRDAEEQLPAGVEGTVAGWGLTLDENHSTVLQKTALPVVSFDTCFDALARDLRKLYTDDKFCAGAVNENWSVCRADSGGGMVFATGDRSYLRGVASVGFTPAHSRTQCNSQLFGGFTLVSEHLRWIKTLVNP